jgi:hypothetical protein
MAVLQDVADLLPLLSQGYEGSDPVRSLRQRGHHPSETLEQALREDPTDVRVSSAVRERQRAHIPWGTRLSALQGEILPRAHARLSPVPEYDLLAVVRMSFLEGALERLLADGMFPAELEPAQVTELCPPELLGHLQLASPLDGGAPALAGDGIEGQAQRLVFTGPPRLHAPYDPHDLAPAPLTGLLEVVLPLRLEVEVTGPRRAGHSSLLGALHLQVPLETRFDATSIRPRLDLTRTRALRLEIDALSALVPRTRLDADALRDGLQQRLPLALRQLPALELPPLGLPAQAFPLRVDPGVAGEDEHAALVLGVQMEGNPSSPVVSRQPLQDMHHDAWIRLHEGYLSRLYRSVAQSPEFLAAASEEMGLEGAARLQLEASIEAVVGSAVVGAAGQGRLELRVDGRLVETGPLQREVRFSNTAGLTFTVDGGQLTVSREATLTLPTLDMALYVFLSGLEAWLFALPFLVLDQMLEQRPLLRGLFLSEGDAAPDDREEEGDEPLGPPVDVFREALSTPGPVLGLEHKVMAELVEQKVDETAVIVAGQLSLVPDTTSTFVYARCARAGRVLAGIEVELMDQDNPAPEGDDTRILGAPIPKDSPLFTPGTDQVLAKATTDLQGRVHFVLTEAQRTSVAGSFRLGFLHKPVVETLPDLYLRLHLPDGRVLDSRTLPHGFSLNQGPGHWGTRERPLQLDFPDVRRVTDVRH